MGSGHSHGHLHSHGVGEPSGIVLPVNRRARTLLLAIVVPLFLATLVGLAILWPGSNAPTKPGEYSALSPGSYYTKVLVTGVDASACVPAAGAAASAATAAASDKNAKAMAAANSEIRDCLKVTGTPAIADPQGLTTVPVIVPPEFQRYGVNVGDTLSTMYRPADTAQGITSTYGFVDYERSNVLWALAVVYALLVMLVARWRGLAALVGLVFAFLAIGFFILPAILAGSSALLVGVVGASLIMHVVLYTAHGFNLRTTTALVGTLAGVGLTALIGVWATTVGRLSGLSGNEDSLTLQSLAGNIHIGDVVLCGLVLAGLGVLNDVTITQASAVWELNAARPDLSRRQLFVSGMRIGRDHIASTVYTIAFAYAGSALPVLLLVTLFDNPLSHTLSTGEVAVELVRTLVGSIGLVLAIPATTALAVWAVRGQSEPSVAESGLAAKPASASVGAGTRARAVTSERAKAPGNEPVAEGASASVAQPNSQAPIQRTTERTTEPRRKPPRERAPEPSPFDDFEEL